MKNYTHIAILLDRSGSMRAVQDDTIGGFNTFLDEQKKVPGEASVTLMQFSDKCEVSYMDVPLLHVANLTRETYSPSGWTALNDALAKTINDVGEKLAKTPEHERPSKVIVLIMTDGAENSSKEFAGYFGLTKLNAMVKHQMEKYSWNFVFVGANMDSFATASNYGFAPGYTINYVSNSVGSSNAFKSVSKGMATVRLCDSTANFFANDTNQTQIDDTVLDTSNINETINKYKATVLINDVVPLEVKTDQTTEIVK